MRDFAAIIFDLDGVIIDTEALHTRAQRTAFERHGLSLPDHLYTDFRGRSDHDMVEHVFSTYGAPGLSSEELLAHKQEAFDALSQQIELVPGAEAFIRAASQRYPRLAVATSATRQDQLFAFERFGLDAYFEVVVTSEDIHHAKPHPEPYRTAAAQLGLAPEACLVIEDSANGVASAKAAGCAVAAVTTTFTEAELQGEGPDYVVDTFSELAARLHLEPGKAAASETDR